jgi:hypothetical protein
MKRFVGFACAVVVLSFPVSAMALRSSAVITVRATIHSHFNPETPGKITFVPDKVNAGSLVTFDIINHDSLNDHAFEINGRLTHFFIKSGGTGVLSRVAFKKPGRYVGSCPDDFRGTGGIFVVT